MAALFWPVRRELIGERAHHKRLARTRDEKAEPTANERKYDRFRQHRAENLP